MKPYLFYTILSLGFLGILLLFFLDTISSGNIEKKSESLNFSSIDLNALSGEDHAIVPYDNFLSYEPSDQNLDLFSNLGEKIVFLEEQYKSSLDPTLFDLLLDAYILNYQFEDAKQLVNTLTPREKEHLDKKTLFTIVLQSFSQTNPQEYELLIALLDQLYKEKIFNISEYHYYQLLFSLFEEDSERTSQLMGYLTESKYFHFVEKLEKISTKVASFDKVADYYSDGLIAHALMEEGYFALAKKKALPLVIAYPKYVLPLQILAYSNFITHDYERAVEYYSQLLELDFQRKDAYFYYLGVSYYYLGKYSETVIYLSQITDIQYLLDVDRFLVLSYLKLGDQNKTLLARKRLFNHKNIKETDFFSFFQEAFWNFYVSGTPSRYLLKDPELSNLFLSACQNYLPNSSDICYYGSLGSMAVQKNFKQLDFSRLSLLAEKYQKSELFFFMGEGYLSQGETELAIANFMKSLNISSDLGFRNRIKQKILQASDLGNF